MASRVFQVHAQLSMLSPPLRAIYEEVKKEKEVPEKMNYSLKEV